MHGRLWRRPARLSDLPIELLSLIFEKLTGKMDDILSCANVCVTWRSVIGSLNSRLKRSIPFVILRDKPVEDKTPPTQQTLHLSDTVTKKSHGIYLPQLSNQWFHSCSNGWLLVIGSEFPHRTCFLNPLSRSEIKLPSLGKQFDLNFRVITSSSPSDPNCVVLGSLLGHDIAPERLYHDDMVFCRPQDQAWTQVTLDTTKVIWYDIILYKNQFYGVSREFLYRISFDGHAERFLPLPPMRDFVGKPRSSYLVEINGDLVLIVMTAPRFVADRFKLFKLKVDDDDAKIWIETEEDFDGYSIYLDTACSVAVCDGKYACRIYYFIKYRNTCVLRCHCRDSDTSIAYRSPESTKPTQWFTRFE